MLGENLKFLRKKHKLSQQELASVLDIPRTTLGDYERGNTEPNLEMLTRISEHFKVPIDELVKKDLDSKAFELIKNRDMRVLAVTVDEEKKGNIELVDSKAEAGYLESFQDPEYIRELPRISFPSIPDGAYRGFEIQGDSMLPMEPGSIVICSYIERLDEIKDDRTYVVVGKDSGIVYKRVRMNRDGESLTLSSDNELYGPYQIHFSEITEIWQYFAHVSFSDAKQSVDTWIEQKLQDIQERVVDIQHRI